MSDTYILSWDQTGLEACINVTEIEKEEMWNTLKSVESNRTSKVGSILQSLTLRARFNTQRHYEIYAIDIANGIAKEDLESMFNDDPQGSADLIRSRGRQLYSDRAEPNRILIK